MPGFYANSLILSSNGVAFGLLICFDLFKFSVHFNTYIRWPRWRGGMRARVKSQEVQVGPLPTPGWTNVCMIPSLDVVVSCTRSFWPRQGILVWGQRIYSGRVWDRMFWYSQMLLVLIDIGWMFDRSNFIFITWIFHEYLFQSCYY